jgi:hypothetical protein
VLLLLFHGIRAAAIEMTPAPASSQEVALARQTPVRLGRAIRNAATSEVGGRAAALAGAPLTLALGTEQAAHVLATLAARGIGDVVLGDGGLDRDCFDAIVESAADGTWTRSATTEARQ